MNSKYILKMATDILIKNVSLNFGKSEKILAFPIGTRFAVVASSNRYFLIFSTPGAFYNPAAVQCE